MKLIAMMIALGLSFVNSNFSHTTDAPASPSEFNGASRKPRDLGFPG